MISVFNKIIFIRICGIYSYNIVFSRFMRVKGVFIYTSVCDRRFRESPFKAVIGIDYGRRCTGRTRSFGLTGASASHKRKTAGASDKLIVCRIKVGSAENVSQLMSKCSVCKEFSAAGVFAYAKISGICGIEKSYTVRKNVYIT